MHELSVTEGILNFAVSEAKRLRVSRVTAIRLKLGALSGLVPDCIGLYFNMVSKGTPCEGAKLEFDRIPARIRCRDCEYETEITGFRLICPACASRRVDLIAGREAYIDSMEVENGDQSHSSNSELERGLQQSNQG